MNGFLSQIVVAVPHEFPGAGTGFSDVIHKSNCPSFVSKPSVSIEIQTWVPAVKDQKAVAGALPEALVHVL